MKKPITAPAKKLHDIANQFDPASNALKISLLKDLSAKPIQFKDALIEYHETLLFIMSFPPDKKTFDLAEKELMRMAGLLKKQPEKVKESFVNSGSPFTNFRAAFSHDCTRWLLTHPAVVSLLSCEGNVTFRASLKSCVVFSML